VRRVLFDAAHKQVAGNADWIVDSHEPDPLPASPTGPTSWSGGISSWGYDLHASGRYTIKQLPAASSLNWGAGGPGDLKNFEVFVSVEPEAVFTATEAAALVSFAQAGGGIFLVSDHLGAARCGSCVEAWQVINGFLEVGAANIFGVKCDGNDVGTNGLSGVPTAGALTPHFTAGPFGSAATLVYHSGSSVSVVPGNTSAEVIVSSSAGGFLVASQLASGGRLVLLGDSSPSDDGSCVCSATLQGGWAEGSDRGFILNATAWLAHDGS
jgi:hypothetical protein